MWYAVVVDGFALSVVSPTFTFNTCPRMHCQDEKKTVDKGASRERQVRGQRLFKLSPLQILSPLRPFAAAFVHIAAARYPLGPPLVLLHALY